MRFYECDGYNKAHKPPSSVMVPNTHAKSLTGHLSYSIPDTAHAHDTDSRSNDLNPERVVEEGVNHRPLFAASDIFVSLRIKRELKGKNKREVKRNEKQ